MKVLIVDKLHSSMVSLLEKLGLEVDDYSPLEYEDTLKIINDYDGLIIRSKFRIDAEFLSEATNMKFIGRTGAGLDLIDLETCKNLGIEVFGANEGNRVAVAEHMIAMILGLFNNIVRANNEVKNYQWKREENRGVELFGKTVGVIGYGNNGSETAKRLACMGCKVLAYDKYKSGFGGANIIESTLENIFEEADILTLHIPLTDETRGWINESFFDKFNKDIYFCNLARGKIMNTEGLINSLKKGKIKGACLDVLENEKPDQLSAIEKQRFDFLKDHPRVLITPHVGGWTFESYEKLNIVLAEKIEKFLRNQKQTLT